MQFDDARLEDGALLDDLGLRHIASAGARIRRLAPSIPASVVADRPRGLLLLGPEARLVRAVLEPVCPVPLMVWPGPGLPAWVGPLDLVAIIADEQPSQWLLEAGSEARRRGAALIVASPVDAELTRSTSSTSTVHIPTVEADPTASAIAVLAVLGQMGIGPEVRVPHVADAADIVAEKCSPAHDLSVNPGKELALALADRLPLIWGGSVLANRASRRLGEAIRRTSGVPALAVSANDVLAVLRGAERRDVFADPDDLTGAEPVVVLLDADSADDPRLAETVEQVADSMGVHVAHVRSGDPALPMTNVERYVTLLTHSQYGAEYLRIGLGR